MQSNDMCTGRYIMDNGSILSLGIVLNKIIQASKRKKGKR